jgi:hypothetical protein
LRNPRERKYPTMTEDEVIHSALIY